MKRTSLKLLVFATRTISEARRGANTFIVYKNSYRNLVHTTRKAFFWTDQEPIATHCNYCFLINKHGRRLYCQKSIDTNSGNPAGGGSSSSSSSSSQLESGSKADLMRQEFLKAKLYLEQNKAGSFMKTTEQRLKQKGNVLLRDIKETRDKVKEKVEEIIVRENVYTIPNFLCVSRILLSPYLGMLIVKSDFNFALAVLGIAAVTDLLDGWIARTWESQSSKMGSFLDPMADKVLIATLFLSLTYADLIPVLLTGTIIARDVVLVTAGFVIRYKSLPPPRTLSRYFDVTHATAQLEPTLISKINTGVQLLLVGSTLAAPVFQYVDHPFLQCLWYVTGATTVAAGLSYIISKNTYKFLNNNKTVVANCDDSKRNRKNKKS